MTKPRWRFKSPKAMHAWAKRFATVIQPGDIVALVGPLGAGKTTLTQGVVRALGYRGDITSPTFALANEYKARKFNVYHMDMYRLTPAELARFPLEDYFGSGLCLMEWADRVRDRWPDGTLELQLTAPSPSERELTFRANDGWAKRLRLLSSR